MLLKIVFEEYLLTLNQCRSNITTIKFIFSDVCANHFIQLDKPARKMLASICETQCMIVCHETEGNFKPGSTLSIW